MIRNNISVDKVLADLEHDKLKAREAGQYGVAKSCTELQGKYLAMFTDGILSRKEEEQPKFTEEQRVFLLPKLRALSIELRQYEERKQKNMRETSELPDLSNKEIVPGFSVIEKAEEDKTRDLVTAE